MASSSTFTSIFVFAAESISPLVSPPSVQFLIYWPVLGENLLYCVSLCSGSGIREEFAPK